MEEESLSNLIESDEKFLIDEQLVLESHRRCSAAGLKVQINQPRIELSGGALRGLYKPLGDYKNFFAYVDFLFSDTYQSFPDQRNIFVLTDANGYILRLHGRMEMLGYLSTNWNIRPGVLINEESAGTNAVAVALINVEPTAIRGQQHYCQLFKNWTCTAVPVCNARGEPLACFCIATPRISTLGEKLALAKCVAGRLEAFLNGAVDPGLIYHTTLPSDFQVSLTERQHQVLYFFAKGLSYKEIARELKITSEKTVGEHLDAVCRKVAASNRRECIIKAAKFGLL